MIDDGLMTLSETAKLLDLHRTTVANLVSHLGIVPKRMPNRRGGCKGLDAADRRRIRKALGMPARGADPVSA